MPPLNEVNHGYLSFSGMSTWDECPYKFKLSYIDHIKLDAGSIYTHFGSCMHTVLEQCFTMPIDKQAFLDKAIPLWEKEYNDGWKDCYIDPKFKLQEQDRYKFQQQGIDLVHAVLVDMDKVFSDKFGDFEIIGKEIDIVKNIFDINIKGIIDIVIRTKPDNKLHIVDYKSAGALSKWNKVDMSKLYQKSLYQQLGCAHFEEELQASFLVIPRVKPTSGVKWIDQDAPTEKLASWMKTIKFAIEHNIFFRNKGGSQCYMCAYNQTQHCP